jgi:hypothetical protein
MPTRDGYKTIDIIMQELGYTEFKIRDAIKNLGIQPVTFNADRRVKYYSDADIKRIKEWLEGH